MIRDLHKRRATQPDTAALLRQLAGMVPAGIPVTRCFDILEQTHPHTDTRAGLFKIKKLLLAGNSLHDSMRCRPDWFDTFTCSLIHLGEQTGKLDAILLTLATHHENKLALRRSIRQALFYPAIILFVALTLSCCMFIFVIPAFAELFRGIDKPLPLLTRMIFYLSRRLNQCLPVISSLVAAAIILLAIAWRKHKLTVILHQLTKWPPLAGLLQTLALIRFLRNMALALAAGIPILDALQLTAGSCNHAGLASTTRQLRASLSAGNHLHQAMEPLHVFPVIVRQLVRVGEESGALDKMLDKSAELLETQLNTRIFHLTRLLEPLIMSVLGVLIGGLVIGMYLPVFNLGSTL